MTTATLAAVEARGQSWRMRWRALVARATRGLSWPMLAVFLVFIALHTLFAWPIATAVDRGLSAGQIAEVYARILAADTVRYAAALAGIVAWNVLGGPVLLRGMVAAAVLAAASWLAYTGTLPIKGPVFAGWSSQEPVLVSAWLSHYMVYTAIAAFIVIQLGRETDALDVVERERGQALDLERGVIEARLQVSQAQIEPHFLFNTLANVRRLYALDAASGRAMARHFATVLASALPAMRDARSTLGRELALAVAYLEVQQIRMGSRLAYRIDVPLALRDAAFPPLMLVTLVENAIKHGIGPLEEGGSIAIEAGTVDGTLRTRVLDTGRGLRLSAGTGVGLANIESRLRVMFGPAGRLVLDPNEPQGVIASIVVPLEAWPEASP